VLRNLGVEVNQVRSAVEAIIGRGDRIVTGEVGFTPRAKKVIELAVDEARRLNHRFIGTEHLLLGLIREGEGIASGVLESLGVRLDQARAEVEVLLALRQHKQEEAPAAPPVPAEAAELLAEEEQGLDCANCGARSPGYFRYCFNCGQMLVREDAG
jgi:ATP-dependent Clp protease ATP-binding subunit ClpC